MISNFVIFSFVIAAIATVLLPVALTIVLGVKGKITTLPFFLGAAAFFLSQVVLRIPLLNLLSGVDWYVNFMTGFPIFGLFLVGGITAGLFEEGARLGGAHILKGRRTYKDVISFGLGHGLCEVIFIVGLVHVNNILLSVAINEGGALLAMFAAGLGPEMLEAITQQLRDLNPWLIYFGVFERVCAVIAHIFFTVLVFKSVVERKIIYFILAILAHALFNFVIVGLAHYAALWAAGVTMVLMALGAGYYVLRSRENWAFPRRYPAEAEDTPDSGDRT